MNPLPLDAELTGVERRVIWFEAPDKALAEPLRFIAYVMTYGTSGDVATVRRYIGPHGFAEALDHIPPGILDNRSWAYWNAMAGRYRAPPMPAWRFA